MNWLQKIKLLFTAKSMIETDIEEAKKMDSTSKPGWKSTEFWLNVATQIGTLWGAVAGFIPPKYAAIISTAGIAVYTVARTILKAVTDIKGASVSDPGTATATATVTTAPK